jgi:hypothetical protein
MLKHLLSDFPAGIQIVSRLPRGFRSALFYIFQLIPLLAISFIINSHQNFFSQYNVGNKTLFDLLLIVAITVPWVAQACCLPLYILLGEEIYSNGMNNAKSRILQLMLKQMYIPLILLSIVTSIVAIKISADVVFLTNFFLLNLVQIFFSQSMVLPQSIKRYDIWFLAWVVYCGAMYLSPHYWLLPSLLASCLVFILCPGSMRSNLSSTSQTQTKYFTWVSAGLVMGFTLWLDKFILFTSGQVAKSEMLIFISLIPSVLILNYFYIFRLPILERALTKTISAINSTSIRHYMTLRDKTYVTAKIILIEVVVFHLLVSFYCLKLSSMLFTIPVSELTPIFTYTMLMTLINMILNALLLLRSMEVFFRIAIILIIINTSFYFLSSTQVEFYTYFSYLLCLMFSLFVFLARRKWKRPYLSYFS